MILVINFDGQIVEANEQVCINLGYTHDELLTLSLGDIDPDIDSNVMENLHKSLKSGAPITEQTTYQRKNGTLFPVETRSVKTDLDGKEVLLSLGRNITMRRMHEEAMRTVNNDLKRANIELERSNDELDRFVHIAAHDLKEPLRGLLNYAGMLNASYEDVLDAEGQNYLQSVSRLGVRMQMLIDDLRRYAKLGQDDDSDQQVDLNAVVDEVLETLKVQITDNDAEVHLATTLPTVKYLHSHATIIFQNLISNAIKYNDNDKKRVEIGIMNEVPDSTPEIIADYGKSADSCNTPQIFFVRDNGIGIAVQHQKKIFEMFQRLHLEDAYGGGTGAGLALVKKTIETHGGTIWVDAKPGEGATFYFCLQMSHEEMPINSS